MKRSGGRAGRPFGHVTVQDLEKQVSRAKSDASELTALLAELGHRNSKRALALKDLVQRLLRSISDDAPKPSPIPQLAAPKEPGVPPISTTPSWRMEVQKTDFVDAIGTARSRATLRRVADGPGGYENDVILSGWEYGLSVRSSGSAMDIDGRGVWASPIRAYGAGLRRLAPKLPGGTLTIEFVDGRLNVGGTQFPASEV